MTEILFKIKAFFYNHYLAISILHCLLPIQFEHIRFRLKGQLDL